MQLGLGTAAIGRPLYINIRTAPLADFDRISFKKSGINFLENAYQAGIRYFDTAPGYGIAEEMISEWLQTHPHVDVEIATKWGYEYLADLNPHATEHERKEHSLEMLNNQWEKSLQRTPNVSSLQIHSATFETGVLKNEEVLNRLAEIKSTGIKIGLTTSGDNQTEVLKFALDIEHEGLPLFEVFQVTYNVFDQSLFSIKKDLENKRIIIKEGLANGRVFPNSNYPNYSATYKELTRLAEKYNVGPDAIALRFCMDSIHPYKVLSGASEMDHLQQNLAVRNLRLSENEIHDLQRFAVPPSPYWKERKQLPWN